MNIQPKTMEGSLIKRELILLFLSVAASVVANVLVVSYYTGRTSEKIDDHERRIEKVENQYDKQSDAISDIRSQMARLVAQNEQILRAVVPSFQK
jgi:septal ring factor EnvC (AmiA/AmiB activator)